MQNNNFNLSIFQLFQLPSQLQTDRTTTENALEFCLILTCKFSFDHPVYIGSNIVFSEVFFDTFPFTSCLPGACLWDIPLPLRMQTYFCVFLLVRDLFVFQPSDVFYHHWGSYRYTNLRIFFSNWVCFFFAMIQNKFTWDHWGSEYPAVVSWSARRSSSLGDNEAMALLATCAESGCSGTDLRLVRFSIGWSFSKKCLIQLVVIMANNGWQLSNMVDDG